MAERNHLRKHDLYFSVFLPIVFSIYRPFEFREVAVDVVLHH